MLDAGRDDVAQVETEGGEAVDVANRDAEGGTPDLEVEVHVV